jgi:hypothetical protein
MGLRNERFFLFAFDARFACQYRPADASQLISKVLPTMENLSRFSTRKAINLERPSRYERAGCRGR